MTSDHRIDLGLFTDVLDVLERHGYRRGDDQHAGQAIRLISDLARIYEGTQDHPTAAIAQRTVPPSPARIPTQDRPSPRTTGRRHRSPTREVSTVLAALDIAADTSATAPRCAPTAPTSPARPARPASGTPGPTTRWPAACSRPPEAARTARRPAPSHDRPQPGPQPTRRPASDHQQDTGRTRPRRQADRPLSLTRGRATWTCARCRTPTTCRSPTAGRPGRPEYVIVVDQLRDWQPGQPPSLAELLETGPARTREPEPDLEAEP